MGCACRVRSATERHSYALLFAGIEMMTPVELSIDAELIVEARHFANDWLFKWHGMTYDGGKTDVEDFRGGRIHFAGVKFGHQQQAIFWQAIDRYLRQKTYAIFRQWEAETQSYPLVTRRSSIDGVERALGRFVAQILSRALDTDKRLRGSGYPESVTPYVPTPGKGGGVGGEVARLAEAHRSLIDQAMAGQTPKLVTPVSYWKWIESFYSNNKGLIWFVGILLAIGSTALHFLMR
jgi:hypothetical protein